MIERATRIHHFNETARHVNDSLSPWNHDDPKTLVKRLIQYKQPASLIPKELFQIIRKSKYKKRTLQKLAKIDLSFDDVETSPQSTIRYAPTRIKIPKKKNSRENTEEEEIDLLRYPQLSVSNRYEEKIENTSKLIKSQRKSQVYSDNKINKTKYSFFNSTISNDFQKRVEPSFNYKKSIRKLAEGQLQCKKAQYSSKNKRISLLKDYTLDLRKIPQNCLFLQ